MDCASLSEIHPNRWNNIQREMSSSSRLQVLTENLLIFVSFPLPLESLWICLVVVSALRKQTWQRGPGEHAG